MEGEGLKIITKKRIKSSEEEKDRISSLPDCLIIDEILSRLNSTKQAIRTGVLSKRWQHLWTFVHTLVFNECFDPSFNKYARSDFITCVEKVFTQCRSNKLDNLKISIDYDKQSEWRVNNLIRLAINRNVQLLNIFLYRTSGYQFVLKDDLFFKNSCFTHVTLRGFEFNPTGPIRWNNLRSLNISNARLDEDLIQNILSGSPLLESLRLVDCYGFKRLDITSKSVKNLFFYRYYSLYNNIEINAPYVLSLTMECMYLSMLRFLILLDVSSLVEVNLRCSHHGMNDVGEDTLKEFILKCSSVKKFSIGVKCSEILQVLSRLKAEGFKNLPVIKYLES